MLASITSNNMHTAIHLFSTKMKYFSLFFFHIKKKLRHNSYKTFFGVLCFSFFSQANTNNQQKKKTNWNRSQRHTMCEPNSKKLLSIVDCLQMILSFAEPLEIWQRRLISSAWYEAVPTALVNVKVASIPNRDEDYIAHVPQEWTETCRILDLCPNLTSLSEARIWVNKKKTPHTQQRC